MDDLLLLQTFVSQHWLEAETDQEIVDKLRLVTAIMIVGSNEDHTWAVENQHPRYQYLRQTALLPNPRIGTPWTRLYANYEDCTFITTMGVNTSTFHAIITAGFGHLWYALPIPCTDTHAVGQPCVGRRSLNTEGRLGLVLHWLSSTMQQLSLQQIFALIPSTVSRYLCFALSILLKILRQLPSTTIAWPHGDEFIELRG